MNNKFSERLKETLKNNNISQRQFAKKLNLSQQIINNYCNGKREPSLDTLMLICFELKESADYLLGIDKI